MSLIRGGGSILLVSLGADDLKNASGYGLDACTLRLSEIDLSGFRNLLFHTYLNYFGDCVLLDLTFTQAIQTEGTKFIPPSPKLCLLEICIDKYFCHIMNHDLLEREVAYLLLCFLVWQMGSSSLRTYLRTLPLAHLSSLSSAQKILLLLKDTW